MKRILLVIFILLFALAPCFSSAEAAENWYEPPVITKAYEQSTNKLYLEWTGHAPLYQIFVDGKKDTDIILNHYVVDISKGTHSIVIYPINEIREADTNVSLNANLIQVSGGINIDLAALGLDPKRLSAGMPSEALLIDYIPSQILKAVPDKLSAVTDPENRVILTFEDPYVADEYLLTIKHGKNANYLTFRRNGEEEQKLINEAGSMISLILDPSFLRSQECIIPELNEEYRFAVQLRKYGTDLTNGEEIPSVVNDSKVSKELKYRVSAAWKAAPEITFASQTADGEITLKWDHEDYGVGCEYIVMRIRKVLGVMTGEEELGRTSDHAYKLNDLKNGKYCINIIPALSGEKGTYSADADIDLKNEWVMAPDLACEQIGSNQVKLTWKAPASMDQYHIIVYKEDSHSLFRFINLAYKEYTHLDLEAAEGEMEYVFTYDEPIDPEHGNKLKFKIYGIRKTVSGEEQISATSSRTLIIK